MENWDALPTTDPANLRREDWHNDETEYREWDSMHNDIENDLSKPTIIPRSPPTPIPREIELMQARCQRWASRTKPRASPNVAPVRELV